LNSKRDSLGSHKAFGYEWTNYPEILPEHERQFLGWISVIDAPTIEGKSVVDAGCGNGRNSHWLAKYGAKLVLAFDVEEMTVKVAEKNLANRPECKVLQSSIYDVDNLVEYHERFDYVFSIGVIHHLSDPVSALKSLRGLAGPNGKLIIWVYGKEGNEKLLLVLRPLRFITRRLPVVWVEVFSKLLAAILSIYLRLGNPTGPYWQLARTWNLKHLTSVIFDRLFPRIANYWTQEEVVDIAREAGWNPVRIQQVNGMSWSLLAEK